MPKKIGLILITWLALSSPAPLLAQSLPESDRPIIIVLNDWTSQLVLARVAGLLFEQMGYRVDYVSKTSNAQWGSLKLGLSHVQVEVWEGTMATMFNRMVKAGAIVDAGSHRATTREDWWYPLYVEQLCPGLPDWRALADCAAIFATADSGGRGIYLGGPWEKPDAARIRALGMNFKAVNVKSGDDLWIELEQAHRQRRPIVLFNWTPNWVEAKYPGRFVEFPDYDPACEQQSSWGINSKFLHDCGNPKNGWLKKAAWAGMADSWPCAFETLQALDFDNNMIAELAAGVDVDQLTYAQAAQRWFDGNRVLWQSWIPQRCRMAGSHAPSRERN